jgi:hypothetical protein
MLQDPTGELILGLGERPIVGNGLRDICHVTNQVRSLTYGA